MTFSNIDKNDNTKYEVPSAWWLELKPESKQTAYTKILKQLDTINKSVDDDMKNVSQALTLLGTLLKI